MKNIFKKIKGKFDYWRRTLSIFYWSPSFGDYNINETPEYTYNEIDSVKKLSYYSFDSNLNDDYEKRISEGDIFCFLENQGKIVCYGWINTSGKHCFGELDLVINNLESKEVLYDFYTDENYRGKGLYPILLYRICLRNLNIKIGYSFPSNIGSVKGLNKAGFKFLCDVNGFNKNKLKSMLKKI